MSEESSVCPRCGTPVAGTRFCSSCGINLEQQGTLPTQEEFAAAKTDAEWIARQQEERREAQSRQQQEAAARQAEQRRLATERRRALIRRARWPLVGLCVVFFVGLIAWQVRAVDIPLVSGSGPTCSDWKGWALGKQASYVADQGLDSVYADDVDEACGWYVAPSESLDLAFERVEARVGNELDSYSASCGDLRSVLDDEVQNYLYSTGSSMSVRSLRNECRVPTPQSTNLHNITGE